MSAPMFRLANYVSQHIGRKYDKLKKIVSAPASRRAAINAMQAYDRSLESLAISAPAETHCPPACGASIVAIYFSCHGHFAMLDASLRSLLKNGARRLRRIYIYEDDSDRFTSMEKAELCGSSTIVTVVTGPRVSGWGVDTLLRELALFRKILQEHVEPGARWIMKLDSDVLFLNDNVFRLVAACDADVVGQPCAHRAGLTYAQGGCYFLATHFAARLVGVPVADAIQKLSKQLELPVYRLPEDASIFKLAQHSGARVLFSDFYLPKERIPTFVPSSQEEACLIHFESSPSLNLRPHMTRISRRLDAA